MKELFDQVNHLGDTLEKLSSQNLQNGLALEQTSKVFSDNAQKLSSTSSEQSHAIEDVSSALHNITQKVHDTTQNAQKMPRRIR